MRGTVLAEAQKEGDSLCSGRLLLAPKRLGAGCGWLPNQAKA